MKWSLSELFGSLNKCTCMYCVYLPTSYASIFHRSQSFWVTWSRVKSVLQAVRLGYVTKINLTAKAWEKTVQELGKMSAKIAWHSSRTFRYASSNFQREYFKVTLYKTVEFSCNYAILGYL